MELFLNATSPYARLARIVVLEKGLEDEVTLHWCDPWADEPALLHVNPGGRIPALVAEDGTPLSEAFLIATYLDRLGEGESILPPSRLSEVLHQAGLGQNLMDAAFTTVISRKHYGTEIDHSVLGMRRWGAIHRILARLEAEKKEAQSSSSVTLGDISIAVALDYLEFRLSEIAWKDRCPNLAAWHGSISARKSFEKTSF
jgi:glutathione S-transferase